MRNKKINIVVGGRFHAGQLYNALNNAGHDVKIYCSSPKRFFKNIDNNDIVFIPKPFQIIQKITKKRLPKYLHEIDKIFFGKICSFIIRDCDILWGFNGDSLEAAKKLVINKTYFILDRACPHIDHQNDLLIKESRKLKYSYNKFNRKSLSKYISEYNLADLIVVPSQYSASSFLEEGYANKLRILPLDSNISKLSTSFKDFKSIGKRHKLRIGVVGGSFLRKGLVYLLRALRSIEDRHNIQLLIRAPKNNILLHEESRRLCKELDVEFIPYLDDLNDFYQSIDIFVLPSIDEGFGMVVFEALMNSVAVIASDHVGSIDGMVDGEHALIFKSGDEHALKEKMLMILKNNDLRDRIAKNGNIFYESRVNNGNTFQANIGQIINSLSNEI